MKYIADGQCMKTRFSVSFLDLALAYFLVRLPVSLTFQVMPNC